MTIAEKYEKLISAKVPQSEKLEMLITMTDEEYNGWRWYLIRKQRKQQRKQQRK